MLSNLSCAVYGKWIRTTPTPPTTTTTTTATREPKYTYNDGGLKINNNTSSFFTKKPYSSSSPVLQTHDNNTHSNRVRYDSLRVLEWDKVCDLVASFAATSLGRQATKAQLWCLNQRYEESLKLLEETNAAVEIHKHGACRLDFSTLNLLLVKSGIRHARSRLPLPANEAMAVAALLDYSRLLQLNLKAAIKEDADCYNPFMPLSQLIMELVINPSLVRMIRQVIDEDGSIKDSASSALKRSRNQVRMLEKKLSQLMDSLIRNTLKETSFLQVSNINGRWCIKSGTDQLASFKGLLLSSDSGTGSIVEPLLAVPLNDELQQARALVAQAEEDVLLMLTEKMQKDLDDIEHVLNNVIQLDVINARATYSLSFGGAFPDLYLPEDMDESFTSKPYLSEKKTSKASYPIKREWVLYMPKANHPLLLQKHRQNLQKARKDVNNSTADIKRKLQGDNGSWKGETDADLSTSEMQVSTLEQAHPIPVNICIGQNTRVLVITGPNTGGKTICLKTVGLAAMMAKSGLYVLCSESVQIPWFDSIFADIGDEQSLSQSLSTFSGHLKQISDIRSHSTSQSLVLLDEVGAGTNPLEGAALGMSLLESFADSGALLTIATTHHGELKSLKYSNNTFENACMEFDEVDLKPTYNILWGIPGRSNAINISEKLGLPSVVVSNARELYGAASAEINEVIIDMERFKQDFQELLFQAQRHLMLSRKLHEKLLLARRTITEHATGQRYRRTQQISEAAAMARSILHKKLRQLRAYATQSSQPTTEDKRHLLASDRQFTIADNNEHPAASRASSAVEIEKQSSLVRTEFPEVGDMVLVSSLGRKLTVLKVDPSKEEIVVQAGNMKLKLKLNDIET